MRRLATHDDHFSGTRNSSLKSAPWIGAAPPHGSNKKEKEKEKGKE